MRLFLPFFLLSLPACDLQGDAAKETPEYSGQQASETPERTESTPGAAAPGIDEAISGRGNKKKAGDLELEPTSPEKPQAQSSALPSQVGVMPAPAAAGGASVQNGRELVQAKCSSCHSLEVALAAPRSPAHWAEIMELMTGHGMAASEPEKRLMRNYLETWCLSSAAP